MLSALYLASVYTWLASMFFSSWVKYPDYWWASVAWATVGVAFVTAGWLSIASCAAQLKPWTQGQVDSVDGVNGDVPGTTTQSHSGEELGTTSMVELVERMSKCEQELADIRSKLP